MSLFAGPKNTAPAPIIYSGLNVGTSQFDLPFPIMWGQRRLTTNAMGFGNFVKKKIGSKGKGGGGKGNTQYDYSAAVALGLGEGVIDSIARIWPNGSTTTTTTLAALNMTFKSGTQAQTPIGGSLPFQQLAYALTAYLYCPKLDLGGSATIPDNAFECVRAAGFSYTHTTANGWINPNTHLQATAIDCLMSDIVTDLLTNVQYGLGFSAGDIGSLTQFAAYGRAQGLFFSPLLNSLEKATSILDRWAQISNAWIYWSGTQLQFYPLADAALTGNGVTFTPQNDVAYALGPSDYVWSGGSKDDGPVKVTRIDPADAYNRTVLNITDRTLGYISNPLEYKDQSLVDTYGLRDNSNVQADEICDPDVGRIVVQLIGKRAAYIRNTYTFKTSYRFILCLPGTVLTLTEPNIGLSAVRVRVTKIEEDDQGILSFTCEEFPGTTGTFVGPITSNPVTTPTTPDMLADPGSVNTPAVIEPNSSFTGGVAKLIIAASGGPNWGGCTVNISFDGTNSSEIGTINNAARQGLLTANLAAYGGANPDVTNTLSVDCTESQGTPVTSVTHADATALRTLSLVAAQPTLVSGAEVLPTNGELLAFGAVAATGTFAANLTYLERGQYGTTAGAHSIGDQFTAIDVTGTDGTSVAFDLPAQYVGQPIFLKLASFNLFGLAQQDLSTCTEYKYTPTGAGSGSGVSSSGSYVVTSADVSAGHAFISANILTSAVAVVTIRRGSVIVTADAVITVTPGAPGTIEVQSGASTYTLTAGDVISYVIVNQSGAVPANVQLDENGLPVRDASGDFVIAV